LGSLQLIVISFPGIKKKRYQRRSTLKKYNTDGKNQGKDTLAFRESIATWIKIC
jgi:hypothetical protein